MFDGKTDNPADEMSGLVRLLAKGMPEGSKQDRIFPYIARKLRVTSRRAKGFWQSESDCIRSQEMDRARALSDIAVLDGAIHALEEAEQHHLRRAEFYRAQREAIRGRTVASPRRQTYRADPDFIQSGAGQVGHA
ncbi:hypothetical protein [Maritalea porphyrae]|uniref:hypothetical protein n=1 Tax=Maritalea porphyrae TaxID=880732 RepID=UPI0022AF8AA2|nr:hypothetical protein [Maritalea porphyrae]MCZ4270762.1 hypothetical protein [Maritalea porphyrae]